PLPPPGFRQPPQQSNAAPPAGYPEVIRPPAAVGPAPQAAPPTQAPATNAALPPEDQPEVGEPKALPPQFKRQLVDYAGKDPAGTIVIDTSHTFLYLTL